MLWETNVLITIVTHGRRTPFFSLARVIKLYVNDHYGYPIATKTSHTVNWRQSDVIAKFYVIRTLDTKVINIIQAPLRNLRKNYDVFRKEKSKGQRKVLNVAGKDADRNVWNDA